MMNWWNTLEDEHSELEKLEAPNSKNQGRFKVQCSSLK
jgi:hypothetical protein